MCVHMASSPGDVVDGEEAGARTPASELDQDVADASSGLTSSDYVPKAVDVVHSEGKKKRMVSPIPATRAVKTESHYQ